MRVLLPAPFSPQRARTCFGSRVKETPSRARTPGKSLVIDRSSSRGTLLRPLVLRHVLVDVLHLVVAVGDDRAGQVGLVDRDGVDQHAGHVLPPVVGGP